MRESHTIDLRRANNFPGFPNVKLACKELRSLNGRLESIMILWISHVSRGQPSRQQVCNLISLTTLLLADTTLELQRICTGTGQEKKMPSWT